MNTGSFGALVCVCVFVVLIASPPASADPGDFDSTFGGDGRVITDLGGQERGSGVAVGPDNRVVVAGWTTAGQDGGDTDFALVRYDATGSLDSTFGSGGVVTTDFPSPATAPDRFDEGTDVAIAGGKIAVAGTSDSTFGVAMYHYSDGSLDTSFSGDGMVRVDIPGGESDFASGVAVQPDGKVVVAGRSGEHFAVVRLRANGNPDASFHGDGVAITEFGTVDEAHAVAVQADGRIVAVGSTSDSFTGRQGFALARYTTDGRLDPSFSADGKQTTSIAGGGDANAVVIQSDGKIVVVGWTVVDGTQDVAIARYRRSGSLDRDTATSTGFSRNGKKLTNFGDRDRAEGVAIQPDGKIVVAGNSGGNWALARYTPAGDLDTAFSGTGKVTHPMGSSTLDIAGGVVVGRDGKLVAGGFAGRDFAAARYLAA
jgi:uncharacterized delta-60 repeat protein